MNRFDHIGTKDIKRTWPTGKRVFATVEHFVLA